MPKSKPIKHRFDSKAEKVVEAIRLADAMKNISVVAGRDDELMGADELADWLRVSRQWVYAGRIRNFGPPYISWGKRILYRKRDVIAWLESRTHRHQEVGQATKKAAR
jgi:hypothetical protein